ncbi:hypothetical protein N7481_006502 [Penicillium waksmanii]|uniref:uncharacterized protein n=1 Tax=Penicillium waksmanii TaxID=69791 RepID=UPI0025499AEC|nr:uncharacterized protein N7481_006502 [Penicillium waksmanii]KAJ5984403.1 hypothetical protein N7481_006502 [Penicillium waksmanii]
MAFYRDQVLLDEYSKMSTGKNEPSGDFTLDTQDWVQDSDGAWFHYLCKNVNVTGSSQKPAIAEPNLKEGIPVLDQSDSSWIRSGYFLRWAVDSATNPEITLICFDSSFYLKERFQQVPPSAIPMTAIPDPYSLFVIILEELSLQMDNVVWNVMSVFRGVELVNLAPTVSTRLRLTLPEYFDDCKKE